VSKILLENIQGELEDNNFKIEHLEELYGYLNLIPSLTNQRLDRWNGLQVANKLLEGQSLASELHSIALRVKGRLYARRKREFGLAFLERSQEYFKRMEIKSTESGKTAYAEADELHVIAREREAAAEALCTYLQNKVSELEKGYYLCRSAHDTDLKGK